MNQGPLMIRIEKVQRLLHDLRVEALVVDNPTDLYYLTGQELSLGRLIIEPGLAVLFVDGRYYEGCKCNAPCEVMLTSGYAKESAFGRWFHLAGKKLGFDADATSYAEYEALAALGAGLVPVKSPLSHIREIKERSELALLKEAAALGSLGFDYICTLLQPGVCEKEIARELEIFWLKKGAQKLAFSPHIAFGEGSSQPHYQSSERRLKSGDTILIDIGVVLNHYHSDMTRVLFYGEPPAIMKEIYRIVYEAYEKALEKCKPGVLIGDVDKTARDWIGKKGYQDHFMHGLGHGVGLQIHESPRVRSIGADAERPLQEGMVITIEPGIYISGVGGVRLEDTIAITAGGYENLTQRPISAEPPFI